MKCRRLFWINKQVPNKTPILRILAILEIYHLLIILITSQKFQLNPPMLSRVTRANPEKWPLSKNNILTLSNRDLFTRPPSPNQRSIIWLEKVLRSSRLRTKTTFSRWNTEAIYKWWIWIIFRRRLSLYSNKMTSLYLKIRIFTDR